jgi:hypothetical protein
MDAEKQEIRKLKKLLSQRLNYSERTQIERRLRELQGESGEPIPSQAISPYLLGVWDKPTRLPDVPTEPATEPKARAENQEKVAEQKPEPDAVPTIQELSPEQAETVAQTIVALAERIEHLRSFWARTLSLEIAQQAERCLARLQELATQIPRDLAEVALGSHASLLTQKVRNVRKQQVSENIQVTVLPPSAPSLDQSGKWSDLYYALNQPRFPRQPQHPPSYVPDGLQQFL